MIFSNPLLVLPSSIIAIRDLSHITSCSEEISIRLLIDVVELFKEEGLIIDIDFINLKVLSEVKHTDIDSMMNRCMSVA